MSARMEWGNGDPECEPNWFDGRSSRDWAEGETGDEEQRGE
jgi:hypothetical protein